MTVRIEGAESQSTEKPTQGGGGRRVSFGTVPQFDFAGPGVKVDSVVPNSPAKHAGIQAGDVLIRIDETEITDLRAFSAHLKTLSPGQEITATMLRDGSEITLPVRVKAR